MLESEGCTKASNRVTNVKQLAMRTVSAARREEAGDVSTR
jgi:hypothetical protein